MGQGLLAVSPQSRYPTTGSIICFCGLHGYVEVAIDAGLTDAHVAEARLALPQARPARISVPRSRPSHKGSRLGLSVYLSGFCAGFKSIQIRRQTKMMASYPSEQQDDRPGPREAITCSLCFVPTPAHMLYLPT